MQYCTQSYILCKHQQVIYMTSWVGMEGEQSTETIEKWSAYIRALPCLKVVQEQSAESP